MPRLNERQAQLNPTERGIKIKIFCNSNKICNEPSQDWIWVNLKTPECALNLREEAHPVNRGQRLILVYGFYAGPSPCYASGRFKNSSTECSVNRIYNNVPCDRTAKRQSTRYADPRDLFVFYWLGFTGWLLWRVIEVFADSESTSRNNSLVLCKPRVIVPSRFVVVVVVPELNGWRASGRGQIDNIECCFP